MLLTAWQARRRRSRSTSRAGTTLPRRSRSNAPLGYRGVLGQAAGTQVGTVSASVLATRISADAVLPLTLTLVTDDPARYLANPCAPGTHPARLQLNRGVLAAPTTPGRYVWPAFFTPYPAGSGAANAAATVQSRAIVQLRGHATLTARYLRRTNTFRLPGSVTEFRIGVGGATVEIWKGLRPNRLHGPRGRGPPPTVAGRPPAGCARSAGRTSGYAWSCRIARSACAAAPSPRRTCRSFRAAASQRSTPASRRRAGSSRSASKSFPA
jgi:hypothetical protein